MARLLFHREKLSDITYGNSQHRVYIAIFTIAVHNSINTQREIFDNSRFHRFTSNLFENIFLLLIRYVVTIHCVYCYRMSV